MRTINIAKAAILCLSICFLMAGCANEPYSDYDLSEYITAGKYEGLKVEQYSTAVSAKEINAEITRRLKNAATSKTVTSGIAKKGDSINIDYVGRIDGKTFEGGSSSNVDITLGASGYIDGFDKGLYGKKIGSTTDLNLKFPADYGKSDLAGKAVVFTVKINSKKVSVLPKLDVNFIKNNSKETTVKGYRNYIRSIIQKDKKEKGISDQKDKLWASAAASFKMKQDSEGKNKYPEDEVSRVTSYITDKYASYAKQYNMPFDTFLKSKMGMTAEQFKSKVTSVAQEQVRTEMICYYIAKKQDITVSKQEYKDFIDGALKKLGYNADEFKNAYGASYEEYNGAENVRFACYLDKVEDYLLKKAVIVKNK